MYSIVPSKGKAYQVPSTLLSSIAANKAKAYQPQAPYCRLCSCECCQYTQRQCLKVFRLLRFSRVEYQHRLPMRKRGHNMSTAFPLPAEPFQKKGFSSRRWSARRPGKNFQSAIELIGYGLLSSASPTATFCLFFLDRTPRKKRSTPSDRNGKGWVQNMSPSQVMREHTDDLIISSKSKWNLVSRAHLWSRSQKNAGRY